jgi:hypothetical protein
MNDYTAIRAVSLTLKELLKAHITDSSEPQLSGVPITLMSPKEQQGSGAPDGVSLWLYRVTRNGDMLNLPPARPAPNQLARQPLSLDLYYLVTPVQQDPETEQALLGRVLQVFHDHSILGGSDLQDTLAGSTRELRLTLETLSLEQLTSVWYALQESYRPSVSYHVQVVNIDSDVEPTEVAPVSVREAQYAQILSVR